VGDMNEQQRLTKLYEQLRLKLLDLSRKNPMPNYRLGIRSKRHLQIVDEVREEVQVHPASVASVFCRLRVASLTTGRASPRLAKASWIFEPKSVRTAGAL
jgi:hypothetical protein